jgi:hypothetical protein
MCDWLVEYLWISRSREQSVVNHQHVNTHTLVTHEFLSPKSGLRYSHSLIHSRFKTQHDASALTYSSRSTTQRVPPSPGLRTSFFSGTS